MKKYSYFILVSDDYIKGAIKLIESIRKYSSLDINFIAYDLSKINCTHLESLGVICHRYPKIKCSKAKSRPWHIRKEFAETCFQKLHLWHCIDYEKILYLDSDTLLVDNVDSLFDKEVEFAACPATEMFVDKKTGEKTFKVSSDKFNGGVLLIRPNKNIFHDMMEKIEVLGYDHDPSDQGFLNEYFKNRWINLGVQYNLTRRFFDVFPEDYNKIKDEVKIYHYTLQKPWNKPENTWNSMDLIWNEISPRS